MLRHQNRQNGAPHEGPPEPGSKIVDMLCLHGGKSVDVAECVQHACELARRVAEPAGLRHECDATDLDVGVLVVEGLETARRNALKQDSVAIDILRTIQCRLDLLPAHHRKPNICLGRCACEHPTSIQSKARILLESRFGARARSKTLARSASRRLYLHRRVRIA